MQGQQGFDGRGQVLGEACGQQHEVQNHAYIPCAATAKKRKAGGVDTLTGESAGHTAHGVGMRLPEVVATLAAEGEVLQWSEEESLYVVLDGPGFERRFNELRLTRGKKVESASYRPFSRMHTHFVLVRGEKWAGTGSAFKFKKEEYLPAADPKKALPASNVSIQLHSTSSGESFQMTLQHFLDVTGAGDVFRKALQEGCAGETSDVPSDSSPDHTSSGCGSPSQDTEAAVPQQPLSSSGIIASELDGLPIFGRGTSWNNDTVLAPHDVGALVETMWGCDSKGDQAYFFMRKEGTERFRNGAIVKLRSGCLVSDADMDEDDPGLLMVVSDNNAKWKGEPLPTPAQESLGHWCCFLGQVPVTVEGSVKCGDFIGPKADGCGVGVVRNLGSSPVIGIALVDKNQTAPAVVKTMCFAGLNAIHRGSDFTENFKRMRCMAAELERLRSEVRAVEHTVGQVSEHVGNTDTDVRNLRTRLERSVYWLNSRMAHVEANMSAPVAMPILPQHVAPSVRQDRHAPSQMHTEAPVLPVDDGSWRYYDPRRPRSPDWLPVGSCALVGSWAKQNKKLCALVICAIIAICAAGPAVKRFKHQAAKKAAQHGKGGKSGAQALAEADACRGVNRVLEPCNSECAPPRCKLGLKDEPESCDPALCVVPRPSDRDHIGCWAPVDLRFRCRKGSVPQDLSEEKYRQGLQGLSRKFTCCTYLPAAGIESGPGHGGGGGGQKGPGRGGRGP